MNIFDNELNYIKDFILNIVEKHPKSNEGLELLCDELISIGFDEITKNSCEFDDNIGRHKYYYDSEYDDIVVTEVQLQISNVIEPNPIYDNAPYKAYYLVLYYPLNKYIGLIRNAKIKQIINGSRD